MSCALCSTNLLSKRYGQKYALKDVTLQINPGEIYGLIGKNGAGKTTLMRLIAGLSFPTSGDIKLFDRTDTCGVRNSRSQIGFMIEGPCVNPSMTAMENLKLFGILHRQTNLDFYSELIDLVGLNGIGRKRVRDFSLGMKQRLGIAIALVGNPKLLILDEPINGLDPIGVKDMREILIHLCRERGIAILLSSHNLPELYQVATQYIIIDKGLIVKELSALQLEMQCRQYLQICTDQPQTIITLLKDKLQINDYDVMPDHSIRFYDGVSSLNEVAKIIQENRIFITSLSVQGESLESYFLSIVGGQ